MSSTQKRISWGVVLSAITFVAGLQLKGCNTYAQMSDRVTAVETRQTETEKQHTREYEQLQQYILRVDAKVDRLLERAR